VNDAFRQALDEIKQRLPMEEVVRWYLPEIKRQGALWVACCPFHEEKTPSFKVDPRRGTWHCYGACSSGGDQIAFVERANRVEFREAVEILASRAGVSLPDRRAEDGRREEDENQPLYDVLARAQRYFARRLRAPEGAHALEYLHSRGLGDEVLETFGVGWAGAGGADGLVSRALAQGIGLRTLVAAGLAREGRGEPGSGAGRAGDFFFNRVTFPVRDLKGRTVGFGARRIEADAGGRAGGGPKYVNTPETVLFHKGRLVYGLDRALESVRKGGHLVLVEGYTDVMAAHQAGLEQVVAVLGTATTEEHAAAVRRSGARRVSLVFDGDEAGRRATYKALHGLLSLDLAIDVVRLTGGEDPCDLLVRPGGAESFTQQLAGAREWFEHLLGELDTLEGEQRWAATDRLLEMLSRLSRPLVREARLEALAAHLGVPSDSVRAQLESLPERRRAALRREPAPGIEQGAPVAGEDPRLRRDWRLLVGAVLAEPQLAPQAAAWEGRCPFPDLAALLSAALAAGGGAEERVHAVLAQLLGEPARQLVVPLLEEIGAYEDVRELYADAERTLVERATRRALERDREQLRSGDGTERERLERMYARLRRIKIERSSAVDDSIGVERDSGTEQGPARRIDPASVGSAEPEPR